jgi:hypothetical protein
MSSLQQNSPNRSLCGTNIDDYIWCNSSDTSAIGFATLVWIIIIFSMILTITIAAKGDMLVWNAIFISLLVGMSLWCHAKTMFSDPGAVPANAMPLSRDSELGQILCGRYCNNVKFNDTFIMLIFIIFLCTLNRLL